MIMTTRRHDARSFHSVHFLRRLLTIGLCCLPATSVLAQDLAITNGRILDGRGGVIDNGSVIIEDGRISAVSADVSIPDDIMVVDAGGKTVMPGFVDAHRHVIAGNPDTWLEEVAAGQMQDFLEAGFTTVLSAIDPPPLIAARDMIERGEMTGPRLLAGTIVPVAGADPDAPPPAPGDPARTDPARIGGADSPAPAIPDDAIIAMVQSAADNGYDYLKTVVNVTPGGPEIDTLKLIIEEGERHGLPTIVHAVSLRNTMAALEAEPDMLVHTPHIGRLDENPQALQAIADAGIPMTSTLSVFVPHFDEDGQALFRDGEAYPWDTLSSAGIGPVNARLLWEAGVTYGYGTDTQWHPRESLLDELRALRLVFSPREVVTILTANAAEATLHGDEFGTLEAGKAGDVVIVDGDPLTDSHALLDVVTTIKGGQVVYSAR